MEGDVADAFKNLMDAYTGEGVAITGLYGTEVRPEYMYLVFTGDIGAGVTGDTFLRATSKVAGYPIKGGFVHGENGATKVTCAPYGAPALSTMCFISSTRRPAMAFAFGSSATETLHDLLSTSP